MLSATQGVEFKVKVQGHTISVDEGGVSCDCPRVRCWHTDALMAFMRTLVESPGRLVEGPISWSAA